MQFYQGLLLDMGSLCCVCTGTKPWLPLDEVSVSSKALPGHPLSMLLATLDW